MQARLVAEAKRKHPKEVDWLADSYAERDSRSARTQQAARAAARAEALAWRRGPRRLAVREARLVPNRPNLLLVCWWAYCHTHTSKYET